jgi:hypothetical protein
MATVDDIYTRCMQAARLAVGYRLRQLPAQPPEESTPAVYDGRYVKPGAQMPSVMVVLQTRVKQGSWATNQYNDRDTGHRVTETVYDYFVSFGVYGGDALSIAGELEQSFVRQDIQSIFCHDNFAGIADTFPSASNITPQGNQKHQFASFLLKLTVNEKVVEEIDGITSANGTLRSRYRGSETDIAVKEITTTTNNL